MLFKIGFRLLALLSVVFSLFCIIVVALRKPLQGTIFPPYGMSITPTESFGNFEAWQFDALLCLVLMIFSILGAVFCRRRSFHPPKAP